MSSTMMFVLIVSILISIAMTQLTCDGATIDVFLIDGKASLIPLVAGVCTAQRANTSIIYKCTEETMFKLTYNNSDCTGDLLSTLDYCNGYSPNFDCNVTCGQGGCNYIKYNAEKYVYNYEPAENSSHCNDDGTPTNVTWDYLSVVVDGYCYYTHGWGWSKQESNGSHVVSGYWSNSDCSGRPSYNSYDIYPYGASCVKPYNGLDGWVFASFATVGTANDTEYHGEHVTNTKCECSSYVGDPNLILASSSGCVYCYGECIKNQCICLSKQTCDTNTKMGKDSINVFIIICLLCTITIAAAIIFCAYRSAKLKRVANDCQNLQTQRLPMVDQTANSVQVACLVPNTLGTQQPQSTASIH